MPDDTLAAFYAVTLLVTATALALLAFGLLRKDRWNKVRLVFGLLVSAISVWALGDFFKLVTPDRLADTWALVRFFGICPVGALWLLLAFLYTGGSWAAARRFLPLLFAPAFVSYSLLVTNSKHHLFFSGSLSESAEYLVFGPAYWVHTFFSYLFIVSGILLYIFIFFRTSEKIYRRQTLIMILGCLVPFVGNVLFVLRVVNLQIDITPLLLLVSVILYIFGIFRLALADLRPIAVDTILANLHSGILIFDHSANVVGANPFFYEVFDLRRDIVGTRLRTLVNRIVPVIQEPEKFQGWIEQLLQGNHPEPHVSLQFTIGGDKFVDVTYSPIYEENRQRVGGILVFRDMTEWIELQRSLERDRLELARRNADFSRINEQLLQKNEELERFNRFAVAREMEMIEMKHRLRELEQSR